MMIQREKIEGAISELFKELFAIEYKNYEELEVHVGSVFQLFEKLITSSIMTICSNLREKEESKINCINAIEIFCYAVKENIVELHENFSPPPIRSGEPKKENTKFIYH